MHTNIIQRFVMKAEGNSLGQAWFLVFCWVFLRIFFEGILESWHQVGFSVFSYRMLLTYFVHFPLFYFSLFILLVLLIALLLHESVANVTKAASIGLGFVLFVPLIDFFMGQGYTLTYPLRSGPYFMHFLNPFVSLVDIGVSPGQRITVVLISLLIGVYAFSKTEKFLRSIIVLFASLAVTIIFGGITTLLALGRPEFVYVAGGVLFTDTQKYSALYILVLSLLLFVYLFQFNRKFAGALLRNLRLERVVFYGGIAVFGFAISLPQRGVALDTDVWNYVGIAVIFLSTAFGFWSLQIFNDIFDADIDRIGCKKNLMVSGLSLKYCYSLCVFLFALSLCYALIINFSAFLVLFAYLLLGVIYSMPPVRLKRLPIVSTFIEAVAVCLCIGLGFSVYYGSRALAVIPGRFLIPTLIGVTLGFAAKDIGHVRGDRQNGVITLPVLLYDPSRLLGRISIALVVSCSYLVYAIFIKQSLPGAVICAACTFAYTVAVKKTSEIFYFLMLYIFSAYLFYVLTKVLPF